MCSTHIVRALRYAVRTLTKSRTCPRIGSIRSGCPRRGCHLRRAPTAWSRAGWRSCAYTLTCGEITSWCRLESRRLSKRRLWTSKGGSRFLQLRTLRSCARSNRLRELGHRRSRWSTSFRSDSTNGGIGRCAGRGWHRVETESWRVALSCSMDRQENA